MAIMDAWMDLQFLCASLLPLRNVYRTTNILTFPQLVPLLPRDPDSLVQAGYTSSRLPSQLIVCNTNFFDSHHIPLIHFDLHIQTTHRRGHRNRFKRLSLSQRLRHRTRNQVLLRFARKSRTHCKWTLLLVCVSLVLMLRLLVVVWWLERGAGPERGEG